MFSRILKLSALLVSVAALSACEGTFGSKDDQIAAEPPATTAPAASTDNSNDPGRWQQFRFSG